MGKEVLQNDDVECRDAIYKYLSALMEMAKLLLFQYGEELTHDFINGLSGFDDEKWARAMFDAAVGDAPGATSSFFRKIAKGTYFMINHAVFTICLMDDIVATLQYEIEAMDMYHSAQEIHERSVALWDVSQYNQQTMSRIEKERQKVEFTRTKMLELYSRHRVFYLQCLTGGNEDTELVEQFSLMNVMNDQEAAVNRARQLRRSVIKRIPRNQTADILPLMNFWENFQRQYYAT